MTLLEAYTAPPTRFLTPDSLHNIGLHQIPANSGIVANFCSSSNIRNGAIFIAVLTLVTAYRVRGRQRATDRLRKEYTETSVFWTSAVIKILLIVT